MQGLIQIELADQDFLHHVEMRMAEAVRCGGDWIACRPGCTQCCMGPFAITALDAFRLQRGIAALDTADPERAARVRSRAAQYVANIGSEFLEIRDEDSLPPGFDDAPCPVLDPLTGRCDLYEWRPVTCRTFGPATAVDGGFGACELCYSGASDDEIAACAIDPDPDREEGTLIEVLGGPGWMLVASAAVAQR